MRHVILAALTVAAAAGPGRAAEPSQNDTAAPQAPFGCLQDPDHHPDAVDCTNLRYGERRWRVQLPTILRAGPSRVSMKVFALKRGEVTRSDASSTIDGRTWYRLKADTYQGWVQQAVLRPLPRR